MTAGRNPSAIVAKFDATSILLDCGDGTTRALIRYGINPISLDGAIITHMHPDHSSGIAFLIQTLHLLKREPPFKLFVPLEAIDFMRELILRSYLFTENLGFDLSIEPLHTHTPISFGEMQISPYLNRHMEIHSRFLPSHPELSGEAYSIAILADGKKIVYSSDILDIDDLLAPAEGGGKALIVEATHIDKKEIEKLILKCPFEKIVLTHIPDSADNCEDESNLSWITAVDGMSLAF